MGSEKTSGLVPSGLRAQKGVSSHRKSRGLEGPSEGRAPGRKPLGRPRVDGWGVWGAVPSSAVKSREERGQRWIRGHLLTPGRVCNSGQ